MADDFDIMKRIEKEMRVDFLGAPIWEKSSYVIGTQAYRYNDQNKIVRLFFSSIQKLNIPELTQLLESLEKIIICKCTFQDIKQLNRIDSVSDLTFFSCGFDRNPIIDLELKNLKKLNISQSDLTEIPTEITKFRSLKSLFLVNNNLTVLPFEVIELPKLEELDVSSNKLHTPPQEIADRGIGAIQDYYLNIKPDLSLMGDIKVSISVQEDYSPLREAKILFIGDGSAGKTSLMKRIVGEKFNKNESQTHGINIRTWNVESKNGKTKTNIWDFGGQEIMHATHQFFLSRRSLYVLVLDGRKEENVEYWLKHIESFGGGSPIIVVINKIDQNPGFDVNRSFLMEKYQGIKGFCKLSCLTDEGISEFQKCLVEAIDSVELLNTMWPSTWFEVKKHLERMEDNFICFGEYKEICENNSIEEESSQETLVEFLHDLGVILHFSDFALKDTHVLEPKWVTGAVYKIVNSKELSDNKGILELRMLDGILKKKNRDDFTYPPDKYKYIIDLMMKFELCFEIDKDTVLVPDLLEKQEPEFRFDYDGSLKFVLEYDFLPRSVMPRFIVRRHKDIKERLRWRTGVVLKDNDTKTIAVVKSDNEERKIYIYVDGEQRRDYFAVIRKTFREINNTYKKIGVEEKIPLPDSDGLMVEYTELTGLEQMGEDEYTVGRVRKKYSVQKLLNGIENKEARRNKDAADVYHRHDVFFDTKELEVDHKGMEITNINIGNGNVFEGPVSIKSKIEGSFNTIQESEAQEDVKQLLTRLLEEIVSLSKVVAEEYEEDVQCMADDTESISKEITRQNPREKHFRISLDGIKDAAEKIGKTAKPILDIIGKLGPILIGDGTPLGQ